MSNNDSPPTSPTEEIHLSAIHGPKKDKDPKSANPSRADLHADVEKAPPMPAPAAPSGPPKPMIQVPDGGSKAWLTLAGAWCSIFATFGYINAFGVFQDYYVRVYLPNKSSSDISWIGSVALCVMFSCGIFVGRLFDEGYFHHCMIAGSVLYSFSLFMLSLAKPDHYYQIILSQGIGAGLGMGLLWLPTISVLSHHFAKRRSLAMGISFTGSSVGGIVMPIMMNHLLNGKVGFANGVRAMAGLVTGMMILANVLMRTRLPPRSKRPPGPKIDVGAFFKEPAYMIANVGVFCVALGIFFPIFYIQLDSITHGVDKNLSFYLLVILNGASILGRTLPNFLADKWGVLNVLILSTLACGGIMFGMLGVEGSVHTAEGAVVAISFFYGFWSGTAIALLGVMSALMANNLAEIGVRTGIMFVFYGMGTLAGTPISGALLGSTFVWWKAITFSGVMMFAGTALFGVTRSYLVAKKKTQKV